MRQQMRRMSMSRRYCGGKFQPAASLRFGPGVRGPIRLFYHIGLILFVLFYLPRTFTVNVGLNAKMQLNRPIMSRLVSLHNSSSVG